MVAMNALNVAVRSSFTIDPIRPASVPNAEMKAAMVKIVKVISTSPT
jgi:hypothetical protein